MKRIILLLPILLMLFQFLVFKVDEADQPNYNFLWLITLPIVIVGIIIVLRRHHRIQP